MFFKLLLFIGTAIAASQDPSPPTLDHLLECSSVDRVQVRTPQGDTHSGIFRVLLIAGLEENLKERTIRAAAGEAPMFNTSSIALRLSVFPMPGEAASHEDEVLPLYTVYRKASAQHAIYVNGEDIDVRTAGGSTVRLEYYGSSVGKATVRTSMANGGKEIALKCE